VNQKGCCNLEKIPPIAPALFFFFFRSLELGKWGQISQSTSSSLRKVHAEPQLDIPVLADRKVSLGKLWDRSFSLNSYLHLTV